MGGSKGATAVLRSEARRGEAGHLRALNDERRRLVVCRKQIGTYVTVEIGREWKSQAFSTKILP